MFLDLFLFFFFYLWKKKEMKGTYFKSKKRLRENIYKNNLKKRNYATVIYFFFIYFIFIDHKLNTNKKRNLCTLKKKM